MKTTIPSNAASGMRRKKTNHGFMVGIGIDILYALLCVVHCMGVMLATLLLFSGALWELLCLWGIGEMRWDHILQLMTVGFIGMATVIMVSRDSIHALTALYNLLDRLRETAVTRREVGNALGQVARYSCFCAVYLTAGPIALILCLLYSPFLEQGLSSFLLDLFIGPAFLLALLALGMTAGLWLLTGIVQAAHTYSMKLDAARLVRQGR